MRKLSNYTHARYCTDEADVLSGLAEINEAIKYCNLMDKAIPRYYYNRRNKLMEKLKLVVTKGLKTHEFRYGVIYSKQNAHSKYVKILAM